MSFDMKKLGIDEVEIDIKSLLKRCVENWKLVVIIGIIVAILLPMVMYVKDLSNVQSQSNGSQEEQVELSMVDQTVVDEYVILTEKRHQLELFIENSVLMNMDFTNVYKARMQYYFGNNDDKKFDIANSVRNYILNGGVEYEINDNLLDGEKKFSSELISVAILDGSGILNIEVLAMDEKQCEKYITILNRLVKEYSDTLQQSIGPHSFEVIQTQGKYVSVQNVYDKQREYLQSYKSVETYMSTLESSFNTSQKKYLAMLNGTQGGEDVVDTIAPTIEIKYVIVGFVLGIVLGVGIIVLFVLFGGRIQSENEIQKRLQVSYLGLIGHKQDEMIISKINAMLLQQNIDNVKLISSCKSINGDSLSVIVDGLRKNKILCDGVENVLANNNAVENLAKERNVIFVEAIGKTKVSELYQEALLCQDMHANIIGYIML